MASFVDSAHILEVPSRVPDSLQRGLPYVLGLLLPLGALACVALDRLLWLPSLTFLLGVPIADLLLGEARLKRAESRGARRSIDWLVLPRWAFALHLAVTVLAVLRVALDPSSLGLALVVCVGVSSGAALNVAHELAHAARGSDFYRAQAINVLCHIPQSPYEHRVHHELCATHSDPATSRVGEGLYAFSLRYLWEGWMMVRRRRGAGRKTPAAFRCLPLWPSLLFVGVGALAGSPAPTILLYAQAVIALALACAGNYVAHYGLQRAPARGKTSIPAWNDRHRGSLYMLWAVGRHSSHHAHPSRCFAEATDVPNAPRLPIPYAVAVLLAFCPPIWKWVMASAVHAESSRWMITHELEQAHPSIGQG